MFASGSLANRILGGVMSFCIVGIITCGLSVWTCQAAMKQQQQHLIQRMDTVESAIKNINKNTNEIKLDVREIKTIIKRDLANAHMHDYKETE